MREIRTLAPEDIEVKVKKVIDGKALLLLYKTSRVDMAILDEVYGTENWCDDYKEIKGNLYCGIGIRENKTDNFVWKWDCGIESKEDEEGNQKKGEASDAFKRAGFKLGIGRELYTAPTIWVDTETVTDGKVYKLKDRYATYSVKEIEYNNRSVSKIVIVDKYGNQVFPKTKTNQPPIEEPKTKKVICDRCGQEVRPVKKKNGIIVSAQEAKEKCGGLCAECYLKKQEEEKAIVNTGIEEVEV